MALIWISTCTLPFTKTWLKTITQLIYSRGLIKSDLIAPQETSFVSYYFELELSALIVFALLTYKHLCQFSRFVVFWEISSIFLFSGDFLHDASRDHLGNYSFMVGWRYSLPSLFIFPHLWPLSVKQYCRLHLDRQVSTENRGVEIDSFSTKMYRLSAFFWKGMHNFELT